MKPDNYRNPCVITRSTPYEVEPGQKGGTHSSKGELQIGRVVWIEHQPPDGAEDTALSVYAEGIGLVMVKASDLRCG